VQQRFVDLVRERMRRAFVLRVRVERQRIAGRAQRRVWADAMLDTSMTAATATISLVVRNFMIASVFGYCLVFKFLCRTSTIKRWLTINFN
jgi:hypothetical protein